MEYAERSHRDRWPLAIRIVAGVVSFVVLWPILLPFLWPRIPRWALSLRTQAHSDVFLIVVSLDEHAINNQGAYPSSLGEIVTPYINGSSGMEGGFGRIPRDPWNREYQYELPTPEHPKPHVWSYGADGKRGGTGDYADIDSDELLGGSR